MTLTKIKPPKNDPNRKKIYHLLRHITDTNTQKKGSRDKVNHLKNYEKKLD